MPYSIFDYFYKPKVNQYAGMKPEDVPYDYKGDPTQLVNQPFARPSFFNYLLSPESAGRTSAINQQFATQPLENSNALAQADRMRQAQAQFADSRRPITLKQQAEDITNSLKTGAIFSDSRFPVELDQARTRQMQGLQTGANFADSRAPIILDQNLKERAAYAGQDFERYQKEAATRAQIDADRQAEIAKSVSKVQDERTNLEKAAALKEATSHAALMRNANRLDPSLTNLSDEEVAQIWLNKLESKQLEQAQAGAEREAGLPVLGAQVEASRLNSLAPGYKGAAIESNAQLGALQQNPEIVREIAANNLFSNRLRSETGLGPAQLGEAENVVRRTEGGYELQKGLATSPLDMLQTPTLGGKAVLSPDGSQLPRQPRQFNFNRQATQQIGNSPTNNQRSAVQQVGLSDTPVAKTGDWQTVSKEIEDITQNVHPQVRSMIWDDVIGQLAQHMTLPKEQIGSSRFNWDKKTTLKKLLQDPATSSSVIAQFSELSPEILENIKLNAIRKAEQQSR